MAVRIEIDTGDTVEVVVKDGDGSFTISYSDTELKVETPWTDTSGRKGVIYSEQFGGDPPDVDTSDYAISP